MNMLHYQAASSKCLKYIVQDIAKKQSGDHGAPLPRPGHPGRKAHRFWLYMYMIRRHLSLAFANDTRHHTSERLASQAIICRTPYLIMRTFTSGYG